MTGLEGSHQLLVIDHAKGIAHLIVDALGTTPLYYANEAGRLAFAPTQRGVLALTGRPARLSRHRQPVLNAAFPGYALRKNP